MISELPMFQILGAMARHAAESQKVSATNIAHADEPGYKATKLESFESYMARATSGASSGALSTPFRTVEMDTLGSPNGNTVSLEAEMLNSADAMSQHQLALTVYTKSINLLRTAMGKGR